MNIFEETFSHMNSILFDTLAYAKRLKAAGFTDSQAEVQAEALAEIIEERIATKHDLHETEQTLRRDLKETEQRIIIKLGAMVAASIAITVSLLKLF